MDTFLRVSEHVVMFVDIDYYLLVKDTYIFLTYLQHSDRFINMFVTVKYMRIWALHNLVATVSIYISPYLTYVQTNADSACTSPSLTQIVIDVAKTSVIVSFHTYWVDVVQCTTYNIYFIRIGDVATAPVSLALESLLNVLSQSNTLEKQWFGEHTRWEEPLLN